MEQLELGVVGVTVNQMNVFIGHNSKYSSILLLSYGNDFW